MLPRSLVLGEIILCRVAIRDPYAVEPRKLCCGRWKGRVVLYDVSTGRRRETTRTFGTKKEAKNWAEKEAAQYFEDPNRKATSEETVREYLNRWFPQVVVRPSSVARYRADIAHIQRLIGDRRMNTLNPLDIQNVYTRLLDEGTSPGTVRHVRVIIHGAF